MGRSLSSDRPVAMNGAMDDMIKRANGLMYGCALSIGALLLLGAIRADAAPCQADGKLRVAVVFEPPAGTSIAGVKIDLDYPVPAVAIPGRGDAATVKARLSGMPAGFLSSPNDLDDGLAVALAGTAALPRGPLFSVEFDRCEGTANPAIADFRCKVDQASTPMGALVDGAKCTVTITNETTAKSTNGKGESL
jgi:hypothetical protein